MVMEQQSGRLVADVTRSLGTDFYHMDELLTPDERALRDMVREFCDREVIPAVHIPRK